ncbi:dentin sialophosphoprotein-like isoform X2 [Mizuhopecten yessoensis]|uniref:dentin sialophosphoprotein-like isoform X2 n=1 Tax=Mizuhopecten yessoensis TaxID=6573 RepID=UPI000B45E75B|nr:dentin sialophosphoprotein-like isoform X2 [Mizuhopecten yessoensis]
MSTAALQCLSSTVCVSLPEPIHPCALLPPSDPDVGVFPEVFNRIQLIKLSKPTWTNYTERCLGGGTTLAVTTDPITTTEAETTSVFHTVTHTLTEAVTNMTNVTADRGASTTDSDATNDWVIPVIVVVIIVIILLLAIVAIICKTCHHAKSFNMFIGLERIVIRKSSKKDGFNSYHDRYVVVGPDKTAKGVNSERVMGNSKEVIGKHISISVEDEASSKKEEHGETTNSGITCEIELQISRISGNTAKSEEHLVEQDELCPETDVKDNSNTEHQTQHLTKQANSVDVQNGPQQTPISDQREQDSSDTASDVEQACVSSEMKDGGADKDKVQPVSNNSDIPIIRETSDIKSNSSSNPSNYTDPQPKVNNVESQGSSDIEDTDVRDSRTPQYQNWNSNGLQKRPDSAIKSHTLCLNGTLEIDQKFDHSSEDQFIPNGAPSPGVGSDIKPGFDADVTDGTDDLGSEDGNDGTVDGNDRTVDGSDGTVDGSDGTVDGHDGTVDGSDGTVDGHDGTVDGSDGTVDVRLSNGYSDNDSVRTSGTSDCSRKSDLRSDLFDFINSSLT